MNVFFCRKRHWNNSGRNLQGILESKAILKYPATLTILLLMSSFVGGGGGHWNISGQNLQGILESSGAILNVQSVLESSVFCCQVRLSAVGSEGNLPSVPAVPWVHVAALGAVPMWLPIQWEVPHLPTWPRPLLSGENHAWHKTTQYPCMTPREYNVFDVTSFGQCSSAWTCSESRYETSPPVRDPFSLRTTYRQRHFTNLGESTIEFGQVWRLTLSLPSSKSTFSQPF